MPLYIHWKQQDTFGFLMISEGINKKELLCKKLKDAPFQSFFKIFTNVTFVYLLWPIILQNFKRISLVDSENKVYQVLGRIRDKNALFLGQQEYFCNIHYFYFCLLIMLNSKNLGPKLTHGKNDLYWATGHFSKKWAPSLFSKHKK